MDEVTEAGLAGVQVLRDVEYGEAPVGHGTPNARLRPLLLDVYMPPAGSLPGPRPALVLAHGGAYHRGAKDHDEFEQDGSPNTPVTEYARRFAARGMVCFSVGYRLTQEQCAPQAQPIRRHRGSVPRGRIDYVRQLLGLPPATDAELLNGIEGAISDVAAAFRFVQAEAGRWGIDAQRIAMGGFSAGAFSSIYAAYALGVPAAAIVSLSGGIEPSDAEHYLRGGRGQPPVLLFASEFDLPGINERTRALADHGEACGLGVRRYHVPGKPHFYDRGTEVRLASSTLPGAPDRCTLEAAVIDFLDRTFALPTANPAHR